MKKISNDKMALIIFIVIILCGLMFVLVSNKKDKDSNNNDMKDKNSVTSEKVNFSEASERQMAEPEVDDVIAILHVKDYGDIKVKFFSDVAPKAVENFTTHAKEGYYNNVKFHRVINEFMIQSGDPKGDGTGGESIWNKGFEEEISNTLVPYRGALCMASKGTGTKTLGSQFFIVQANYNDSVANVLKKKGYSLELINEYKKYGGDLYNLYKKYTVFGQVISGMDIVDKIASVKTDSNDKPESDVVIESVEVTTYTK